MIRVTAILLGLALAVGAGAALKTLDPSRQPEVVALEPSDQSPLPKQRVTALLSEAVSRDSANPYRWADLGQAFADSNEILKARTCYTRALELSRDIPQIWLRDANFHFQLGEPEQALATGSRVLKTVPDYDSVLSGYFSRFGLKAPTILSSIGDDRRAARSYTQYLIDHNFLEDSVVAWHRMTNVGFVDDRLTASYIDGLLRGRRYDQAQSDWVAYTKGNQDGYSGANLVFNGGFERTPTSSVFDWRIQTVDDVETVRDSSSHSGHWALRITFDGNSNVSYSNASQVIRVRPGAYRLSAWVRTEGITTNEGPRLVIQDAESAARLNVGTEPFLGTQDWHLIQETFTIEAGTNLVTVKIVRQPSQKFDNKIAGVFRLDSVELLKY